MVILPLIRPSLNVCYEVQIIKASGEHNDFNLVSVYCNLDADSNIFDCLLVNVAAIQKNNIERLPLFLLEI